MYTHYVKTVSIRQMEYEMIEMFDNAKYNTMFVDHPEMQKDLDK